MNTFLQDLNFAFRQLRRAPGFALVAITTLALAIGVSTAVFSVLDATIIRPLPYNHPDRILSLETYSPQGYSQPASWPQYRDWRHNNTSLSALAGFSPATATLQSADGAATIHTVEATDNFFDVFAVAPLLGRTFRAGEDQSGRNDITVLSYEAWQQDFGAAKNVVGTSIRIDGLPTTIVGVMPAGFRFPLSSRTAFYRPFHLSRDRRNARGSHFMPIVGRMKPGVTAALAQADIDHVFQNLRSLSDDDAGRRAVMVPIAEATLGNTVGPLRVLSAAVLCILLIGCVNVAGLLLARGVRRRREFGLRAAIGAGHGRLIRQLLTESALLSLSGAALGVFVALALLQLMRQLLIHALARGADARINLPVLAATVLIALFTGILAGIVPALQNARIAPSLALRSGGSAGSSPAQNRLRSGFIVTQIAIALSLLVCSGLLLRNLHALRSTNLGFEPQGLLTTQIALTPAGYTNRDMATGFYLPLLDRVRAMPGVTSAGYISLMPIESWGSNSDISIVGKPAPAKNQESLAENRVILPGGLETIGAKLVQGRAQSISIDLPDTPLNAVVNQAFVQKFFAPGEQAVGRQLMWGEEKVNIVGVYSNLRQSLTRQPLAEMDYLATQLPKEWRTDALSSMTLVLRTNGSASSLELPIKQAIAAVDPNVPFPGLQTMDDLIADQLQFERLESWLFGIFAALALTLSLVGIYGMVQHEVELRTRDIGVRMALGSSRGLVVAGILRRVGALMVVGVGVGWVLTFSLKRLLGSVLELHATANAGLLVALTIGLACFGIAASLLPARRAASIEPTAALRSE